MAISSEELNIQMRMRCEGDYEWRLDMVRYCGKFMNLMIVKQMLDRIFGVAPCCVIRHAYSDLERISVCFPHCGMIIFG